MKRSKKIFIIAHCIINQDSVVEPLARAKGAFIEIINKIMKKGYGIYQLPCPETEYLGLNRPSQDYDDYNTREYNELCEKLALDVEKNIKKYKDSGYEIGGILGINHSPTCSITDRRGVFMEHLLPKLKDIDYIELPPNFTEENNNGDFLKELDIFLNKK